MYKILTLLLGGCLWQAAAHAQMSTPATLQHNIRLLRSLNTMATEMPAAKTTAIQQRLIARGMTNTTGGAGDSMVYLYDFGRGSEFDFDEMYYNDFPEYPNIYDRKLIRFDSCYRVTGAKLSQATEYAGGLPVDNRFYSNAYTAHVAWQYDANNRLSTVTSEILQMPGGVWRPDIRQYYFYDAAGKLLRDSSERYTSGSWSTSQVRIYSYNSAGYIDTVHYYENNGVGPQPVQYRYCYTYAGNKIATSLKQGYNGTAWEEQVRETMTYTGGQKQTDVTDHWQGGNWVQKRDEWRHLNANNLPDSISVRTLLLSGWDTLISKVVYNSFNNPETIDFQYVGSAGTSQVRYWYQEYDPTAIKDIATAKTLTIYPNPAKARLTIAAGTLPAGQVRYHIINAVGQVMRSSDCNIKGDKIVVDVQGLALGMYWLQLQDAKGDWYRARFSKVE